MRWLTLRQASNRAACYRRPCSHHRHCCPSSGSAPENPRSSASSRGCGNGERIGEGWVRDGRSSLAAQLQFCSQGAAILLCSLHASRVINSNRAGGQPPDRLCASRLPSPSQRQIRSTLGTNPPSSQIRTAWSAQRDRAQAWSLITLKTRSSFLFQKSRR